MRTLVLSSAEREFDLIVTVPKPTSKGRSVKGPWLAKHEPCQGRTAGRPPIKKKETGLGGGNPVQRFLNKDQVLSELDLLCKWDDEGLNTAQPLGHTD